MQNLNVNITPDNYPQSLYYSQNDVGREFKINITDFTIPTGATVKIQATKPSGFGFSVAGTVSGNSVTFETTAEMTDEAGRFPAELVVTSGTDVIGTANFLMVGEMNPHPEGTIDGQQETIIPELTLLVERVEAAASSVLDMQVVAQTLPAGSQASYSYDEDLNKATFGIPEGQAGAGAAGVVASAYSAAKTYKVGDYVLYNSNLYRCTTAITTAEAWTAAHWTQVVLADDVTDLKTDLDSYGKEIVGKQNLILSATWVDDHNIESNGTIIESTVYHYSSLLPVEYKNLYRAIINSNRASSTIWSVHGYDSNGNWVKRIDYATIPAVGHKEVAFVVDNANIVSIRISCGYGVKTDALFYGETIQEQLNELFDISEKLNYDLSHTWVIGGLSANGSVTNNNTDLRLSRPIYLKKGTEISLLASGYKFNVCRYTTGSSQARFAIAGSYASFNYGEKYIVPADTWLMCGLWHTNVAPFDDVSEASNVVIKVRASFEDLYKNYHGRLPVSQMGLYRNDGIYYGKIPCGYYEGLQADYTSDGFGRTTSVDDILAKFDTLVDGIYVTKKDLGESSYTGHDLYEYDFIPKESTLTRKQKSHPKILIISGQHGFEKASIYGLFYFLKDLTTKWKDNPILEYLRNHVIIKVIPCANPYGIDNNAYWNANGVNLNRNYASPGWELVGEPYSSAYSGASAGSEKETKIICDFIEDNSDALLFMDFHTNGQGSVATYGGVNWLDFAPIDDSYFDEFKYMACSHIENITEHFNEDYNLNLTTELCGHVTSGESGYTAVWPSADVWALWHGVAGHAIEGFTGFPNGQVFSADVLKANSELIGNWVNSVIYGCHLL